MGRVERTRNRGQGRAGGVSPLFVF
jgi:hypothetical protein